MEPSRRHLLSMSCSRTTPILKPEHQSGEPGLFGGKGGRAHKHQKGQPLQLQTPAENSQYTEVQKASCYWSADEGSEEECSPRNKVAGQGKVMGSLDLHLGYATERYHLMPEKDNLGQSKSTLFGLCNEPVILSCQ